MSKVINCFWVSPVLSPWQPWAPQRKSLSQTSLKTQPLSAGWYPLPRSRASGSPMCPLQEVGDLGRGGRGELEALSGRVKRSDDSTLHGQRKLFLYIRCLRQTSFVKCYETLGRNCFVKRPVMKIFLSLALLIFCEQEIPNTVFTQRQKRLNPLACLSLKKAHLQSWSSPEALPVGPKICPNIGWGAVT